MAKYQIVSESFSGSGVVNSLLVFVFVVVVVVVSSLRLWWGLS